MESDTIGAIATAAGEGGIGIVRLSGNCALEIAQRIFIPASDKRVENIPSHSVTFGHIVDPADASMIDEGLLLTMHAPHSYTAEDVVEFQCHGGIVPLRGVLELTLREGARMAEPGEFTKRAYLNGRLDLSQAQAVIDVIRAKTDASLRMAIAHLEGRFSEKINRYRYAILRMIAHLEAAIDFPENDIDEIATEEVKREVAKIKDEIDVLIGTAKTGKVLREGLETAIIGKPNVGKSSLLNALLNENRAIVTDIPGTTRDIIEEYANIGGVPLKVIDTAGIRNADDLVEQMGIEKAKTYIERADLILALFDLSSGGFSSEDEEIIRLIQNRKAIVLLNKSDLEKKIEPGFIRERLEEHTVIEISTVSGKGMKDLEKTIVNLVYGGKIQQGESSFVNTVRQAELLQSAAQHLSEVLMTIEKGMSPDFIVIDLRDAWNKLGLITGDTVDEDIIDQIFSQFCIGK